MATQTPSSSTSEYTKKGKRDNSSCSEGDEKIVTSTPSSSSTPRWKYEVFLSFYGTDTRQGFTGHLHDALKQKGIVVFKDDETLKQGESISEALQKAIQKSQYVIVILSANYASSKWCLMELAEIVEWEEKKKLITIIPIFYHVDPSDVRNQRGTFAKAFAAHEKDPEVDIKEIDMWRNAFRKVGNIKGEHIHDRCESTIIQKVCGCISNELNSRFSRHDYDKLVAINSRVEEMLNLMDMESNDVRFIGIHGMGGVGKTTLAEIIYDRVSNSNYRFEGSSFISCIREKSTTARDLASLQKELLSTIMQEEIHVWDHHQGIRMILKMLQNKRVFIVLDDVDSDEQLKVLAGDRKWFGPGSRVIITCRDSHLLSTHEVNDIYKVEQLETEKALQLFSLSAFKETHPIKYYKDLSMDFVNYARGLPLALKVLGRFLRNRTIDAWKSERDKLKAIPNPKIMDVLKISFDGLQELQKELFLDMTCFFGGPDIFCEMLLESFGHYRIDIDVLVEKSLISKSKYGWLYMHDLLKELGREIVRRECPEEPGQRSRLFRVEDLYHVLENDTGTDATKAIVAVDFCAEMKDHRVLKAKALSKMRKLRFFKFHDSPTLKWRGNPLEYMPINELRFLEWYGFQLKSLPSRFQPKNLTVLRMHGSRIKQLWMGSMVLPKLKELDLRDFENLIETPDLTGAPNLERINLDGCRSLCEVHPSIGSLKKLKSLLLNDCSSLEKLPDLSSLECLTHLGASGTAITQILPSSFQTENLTILTMSGSRMKQLWKGLMVLPNLKELDLCDSENLIETPDLTGIPNLERINLDGCRSLCEVHPSIGSLKKLKSLSLDGCSSLEKLPDLSSLECLTHLEASGTAITQILPSSFQPENLTILTMNGCRMKQLWKGLMVLPNLKELDLCLSMNLIETPDLTEAPNLEVINLSCCRSLCEVHPSIGSLKKLKSLLLNECSSLEKLPDLSSLECLTHLQASGTAITQILPSSFQPENLTILTMSGSRMTQLRKGLMVLPNLKQFDLSFSKKLIETPDLTGVPNLEVINLSSCTSLCEVHPSIGSLKKLKSLLLNYCSSLEKLPDLSSLECLTHLGASGTAITQILPSSFQLENLTILTMSGSRMKQLRKGLMVLPNLKQFDLSYSKNLIETPDLTGVPNLEVIKLSGCRSLCEVHPSIGSLKKLKSLLLNVCSSLEKLPDLSSLECLTHLEASGTAITQILPSSFQPENLTILTMSGSRMKQLWKGLMVLPNLKELDLRNSENLIETPDLTGAPNLERINLDGCRSLCEVHPSIGSLKKLKSLALHKCSSLEKLPDLSSLECLTYLWASETAMKQLWKGLIVLPNLKELDLCHSENLIETPDLTGAPNLERINLDGCRSLCEVHPSIGSLKKLKSLLLNDCSSLEKLPDLSSLECLTHLGASGTAITQILLSSFQPENLTILTMSGSRMKQLRKGLMILPNLKQFDLSYSENLIETPDLTGAPNLNRINLDGCRSLCEVHPSIGSLKKLKSLLLNDCSSLEKLPDLSSLECLTYLGAYETAITQIPSVNLMPKISNDNIFGCVKFYFSGSKLMRLKSRDPIYDIGSIIEYQKEGTYDFLEAAWIDFDSKEENILDMAGVVISALDDDLNMIGGWSLGFHMIPDWVQYQSKGSSVKIDLDANMNPEMGCAFFIVCDSDKFFSNRDLGSYTSISFIFELWRIRASAVRLTIVFETDEEYYVEYDCSRIRPILNVSFSKRMGFWIYIPAVLRFLDIQRVIKISFKTSGYVKEVEVRECGVHLVCPDDANSNFFNSIAPFGCSGSSNSDFHRHFDARLKKYKGKEEKEKRKRKLKKGGSS